LQPDSLLERFAAKKAAGLGNTKDFLEIKGVKGQLEGETAKAGSNVNDRIGFKCVHYSVTESNGFVEVTVIKKQAGEEFSFGVRTTDGAAKADSEYEAINKIMEFKK